MRTNVDNSQPLQTQARRAQQRLAIARQAEHQKTSQHDEHLPHYVLASQRIKPLQRTSIPPQHQKEMRRRLSFMQQRAQLRPRRKYRVNKAKIKKSLKAIRDYQKAPFTLVYALAIANMFIGLLSFVATGFFAVLHLPGKILRFIPLIGGFLGSAVDVPADIASFTVQGTIFLFQLLLSVYIFYFYWHYTSFLRRKIGKRVLKFLLLFMQFIPLINLIPWQIIQLWLLQKTMHKRAKKAQKYLAKHARGAL